MNGARSLMDFVDTPVLVGDPDGRAVYVNPAFGRHFTADVASSGGHLANLFEGGAREAVLNAVARVCGGESRARFRLREGDTGFTALASPVEVEEGRVGVIILLTEEPMEERMLAFQRDIQEPMDELSSCLMAISTETGERRDEKWRVLVAEGLRSLERMRKWADGLGEDLRKG
jgi:PAS domain-containing protein